MRIFYRSFSLNLATRGSTTGGLTEVSSWIDSGGVEDLLEMHFRRGRPRPRMEVILVVAVEQSEANPKKRYLNRLADSLGME